MRTRWICCLLAFLGVAAAPGGAAASDGGVAAVAPAFTALGVAVPSAERVVICHGFGCSHLTPVVITAGDRDALRRLLAGRATPEAERRGIAEAVAWFERRVAPAAGTAKARARANGLRERDPSQFDCIDASRNTTSLLVVLAQLRLLRHHAVAPIEARGFFLDGRYPHATAVLREIRTGQSFAVDSWTHNNGEKPDVIPIERWRAAAH